MKISQVIEAIRYFHGIVEKSRFDRVIYGETERECTGIVVTCSATVEIIRAAAQQGANLIVCHEPVFYTGCDDETLIQGVKLVEAKKKLLDEAGITIWRDHDHMHGGGKPGQDQNIIPRIPHPGEKTDYIFYGIMKILGWEEYLVGNITKPLLYEIPETDVPSLCAFLMDRLNLNGVRIVGKADAKVRRVFFCEHVNERHDEDLYQRMDSLNADVFIPLEIIDWTLSSYIRDAVAMGENKAILEMGHFNVEEAGMRYLAESVLPSLFGSSLPVSYIQSGDSFRYIVR